MKLFAVIVICSMLFISNETIAQRNKEIKIKGAVVRIDTNNGDSRVVGKDSLLVVFHSINGTDYYLLPDNDNRKAYNTLIKNINNSILVSGTLFEKRRKEYIRVKGFIFL